ncbi:undecaprenyl phosphate N,N'-diacetylbacillosamine 1-phosphate transferase [mine drainage metagenome]|uniref:Undecaprenyl phosphate N,N'-diacetylbacillosamine 1-phosphate transferase n=1 Tax=mine drainage metagenome TaxID=410659 RepID=A0A1J5PTY8_9ZZZZ
MSLQYTGQTFRGAAVGTNGQWPWPRGGAYRSGMKRVLEVAFVMLTSIITLPLILILAGLVALDGHAPIYWQRRVGKGGRVYNMMKIRTMVPNAHEQLAAYLDANPAACAEWNATQKLKHDPRITPMGRFLRKSSLDELTQLWNVLIGDMSLVGPRPMLVEQQELYSGTAYYALRPGITGLWQVSERNEAVFAVRVFHDTEYYHHLSLLNDIKIIGRTFGVVLRGTGY